LIAIGQPGTQDLQLAKAFSEQFESGKTTGSAERRFWPSLTKDYLLARETGAPEANWKILSATEPLNLLVLEGWFVRFQPLGATEVIRR
jgi:pantothenate kinase-related protein Tda10